MKWDDTHLRIRADHIKAEGVRIEEILPQAFVSELLEEPKRHTSWQALTDLKIDALLKPEGNLFRLQGTMQVTLSYPCVRCAEDVLMQPMLPLDIKFMAGEEPVLEESEAFELESALAQDSLGDEDACVYFQHGIIDLVAFLREQLFLELPIYPSCENSTAAVRSSCHFEPVLVGPTPDAVWEDPVKAKIRALMNTNRS